VLQKIPLPEIARRRGFAQETIVGHIEKIIRNGENLDIGYLKPSSERFNKIAWAFKKSNGFMLKPVKQVLGDSFSYEEIRLVRIFLLDKQ